MYISPKIHLCMQFCPTQRFLWAIFPNAFLHSPNNMHFMHTFPYHLCRFWLNNCIAKFRERRLWKEAVLWVLVLFQEVCRSALKWRFHWISPLPLNLKAVSQSWVPMWLCTMSKSKTCWASRVEMGNSSPPATLFIILLCMRTEGTSNREGERGERAKERETAVLSHGLLMTFWTHVQQL